MPDPDPTLALLDWRRQVADLYGEVRASGGGRDAWERWIAARDRLFREHPQTPLDDPSTWPGLAYFDYDPAWRLTADVTPAEPTTAEVAHSAAGTTTFRRFGLARVVTPAGEVSLDLWWLEGYGGGVFLPFRDATAGRETYGGGRYLLDTVKGADLGHEGRRLVVDFNFAYHPSCVHGARWSCPLAPAGNALDVAVAAGERLPVR